MTESPVDAAHPGDGAREAAIPAGGDAGSRGEADAAPERECRRLYNIIDGMRAGTWEWNVQTGEAMFNPRWAEIVGYRLEELQPASIATWETLAHPEDLEHAREQLDRHFAGELPWYEIEIRMRHRDGHWVWVLDRGRLVSRSADGRPEWMAGTHIDISGLKNVEEALRASEAKHRAEAERTRLLLHVATDAIHILDFEGRVVLASDSFAESLGYTPEEVIGMPLAAWDTGFSPDAMMPEFRRNIMTGSLPRFESRHRRKDGTEFDVEVVSRPVRLDGRPLLSASSRDISERKRAEAALAASELELNRAQAVAGMGSWMLDGATRTLRWSAQAHRMFGVPVGTPLNYADFLVFVHADDRQAVDRAWQAALAGSAYDITYRIVVGGAVKWVRERAELEFGADGAFARASGTVQDITAQKLDEAELAAYRQRLEELVEARTAELLAAKQVAEQASRAKSTFLATVSHELRTPLNAIMGLTHLALRRATDPRQADQLAKAEQSAHKLLGIITDILELSSIESGHLRLERGEFSIGALRDALQAAFAPTAAEKGLALHFELEAGLADRRLRGDAARVRQVLEKLAGNAIKFTERGGVVIAARVEREAGGRVELLFTVGDTGIGITPEDQWRIFNFEQGDGSPLRIHGGSGLGLAISRRLVQAMGGDLGVDSAPGAGSTFWFRLAFESCD